MLKNNRFDNSILVYGKIPPQAVDIETAVIGAILVDKEVIHQVVNILTDDCFYDERNRIMYLAIKSLYNKSNPIDLLTICDELRNLGTLEEAGGFFYVSQSTSRVGSTSNVEYHARVLQDKATLRRLAVAGIEIANAAYEDTTSAEDLAVEAEKKVAKAIDIIQKGTIQMPHDLVTDCLKEIDAACQRPDSITGVYSGFENLDRVTYGWQKSDLIILAARPSMGKTSLAMCFARNAAVDHKIPVAVFSLEMSKRQLMKKLISVESEVPLTNILRGMLDETQMRDTTLAGGEL
jgi:replicative DNA helicase